MVGKWGGATAGSLKVVYDAADSSSTWKLTGTSENVGGFEVRSGTLVLQGANTAHASYSDSGDWTYAVLESAGGVSVNNGATFRLADHALMTANITVNNGTFEMTDVVKAATESVCGGQREDVSDIVGLRGNVVLASESATMKVSTTTANVALRYDGAISGSGNFEKTGAGTLVLSGTNTFSGTKTVSAGTLEFSSFAAMGTISDDASKWKIGAEAVLQVSGEGAAVLEKVSGESSGVLALDADVTEALDLSKHQNLFIGAALGKTINYGASNLELATNSESRWLLGGGGGTLKVLSKLTGTGTLVIGNEVSSGTVFLANTNNDFSGKIVLGGVNNFLDYEAPAALGNATLEIQYGNVMGFGDGTNANMLKALADASTGVLALSKDSSASIDFSAKTVALGAVAGETVRYTGTLTQHTSGGYRFGGAGTLVVDTALSGGSAMSVDAQGMSGGKIIFAQENSGYTGAVTIGAKLVDNSEIPDNGTITVGFENGNALANASSVTLKKGAVLDVSGADVRLKNVAVESGGAVKNLGSERSTFTVIQESDATWAGGALGGSDSAAIDFVKQGAGTLTLGANNAFTGTVSIEDGTVVAASGNSSSYSSFGIASAGNTIYIGENGTLDLTLNGTNTTQNYNDARLHQTVTGTGTVVVRVNQVSVMAYYGLFPSETCSEVTTVLFSQTEAFNGTVRIEGNSRLLVGKNLNGVSNLDALKNATVEVTSGSQVRVTNTHNGSNADLVSTYTNFVLNGSGFAGKDGWSGNSKYTRFAVDSGKKLGALSVDCGSTVYGNVTLATDATVASWNYGNGKDGAIYGAILGGAERTLTVAGDRGLSFKADAASNYGNLKIQNANGVGGFALRVSGGAYQNTTSTALGGGTVSLNAGLRLQFDNSGRAGSNVVYTYGNAFSLANGAEILSAQNTTRLTGSVALAGTSATFTANSGSVLRLEGGITGASGTTATVTAGSNIALGGNAANAFAGTIAAGAGTQLSLLESAAAGGIASSAKITFTDSLKLSLEGTKTFTLDSVIGAGTTTTDADTGAETTAATALNLHYDFTSGTAGSSLSAGTLTADALNIFIELDSAGTLAKGSYTLLSGNAASALTDGTYTLANNSADRFSLKLENGALMLTVDADGRLVWKHQDGNAAWDTSSTHWYSEKSGDVAFAAGDSVIFGNAGIASGNSATSPESIALSAQYEVGTVLARDAFFEISGEGGLAGTNAALVVSLDGTLNLANTGGNVFAQGATVQEGGTLRLSAAGTLTDTALSLKSTGTLSLEADGALAGTTTVVFDGGMLKYGTANAGDISAFLRAGTDIVKLDLNGNTNVALADLTALSSTNNAQIALSNSAYNADAGTGAASVSLGSATSAYETAAGSVLEIDAGVSATHFGKGTLGTLSGAGDYTFDGSAGALVISDMTDFAGTASIVNAGKDNNLVVTNKSAGTAWSISGDWSGGELNFNDFAADDATITLTNAVNSHLAQGKTFAQDFILKNGDGDYAVKITDGSSNTTTTFSGKFSGDGLFLVDRTESGTKVTDRIKFTGDLSGFTGGFKAEGTKAFGFIFSDNDGATTYANNDAALGTGTISNGGASVELNFAADHGVANDFSGAGTVTKTGAGALSLSGDWTNFTGTLTVASGNGGLTLAGTDQHFGGSGKYSIGDTLRVTGTATFDAGATLSFGTLEVAQSASLSMSGGITLVGKADATAAGTLSAGATLSHAAIVGADDGSSWLSNTVATFAGTPSDSSASGFSLKNISLNASTIVAQDNAALTLSGVTLRDDTAALVVKNSATVTLADTFTSLGEISVENGGTLALAGTANLFTAGTDANTPVLATTAGKISFGENMLLYLADENGATDFGESAVTVQLFKVENGATFEGEISTENVFWNGAELGTRTTTFVFDESAGTLTLGGTGSYTLRWSDDAAGTWDKTATAFTVSESDTTATEKFYDRDSVIFATADASVTLGAAVDARTVLVEENLTLNADATNTFRADSVFVASGKTLTLANAASTAGAYAWDALTLESASSVLDLGAVGGSGAKSVSYDKISGAGSVKVAFNANAYESTLSLGDTFTGTAYIAAGCFDLSKSNIGSGSYRLADGVNFQIAGDEKNKTFAGNITLDGTSQLHTNGESNFTVTGGIFGSHLSKNGAGTLTVTGETRLDTFTANAGNGTTEFNGKTTVKNFVLNNGTTNINGAASIESIFVNNGTANINSAASIENLVLNAGTTNINGAATLGALSFGNSLTLSLGSSALNLALSLGDVSLANGKTGTLKITNNSKIVSIASLSGAAGTKLVLDGNAATQNVSSFIFGNGTAAERTGAFAGTIEAKVTAESTTGAPRKLAVVLNGADTSATTVTFGTNSVSGNASSQLGLGLQLDSAIAGLNSNQSFGLGTKVFAMNASSNPLSGGANFSSGTEARTLEIITTAGATHTFYGEVLANVNIETSGEGTQTFAGAFAENSSLAVISGTTKLATSTFSGSLAVNDGATLCAGTEISLTAENQALKLFVRDAGSPLITAENNGKITVSESANVYVDISSLASLTAADGSTISLQIAAESALAFNDENAHVGWWESDSLWKDSDYAFAYDSDSGMLTISIPEPGAFGLLAGTLALALVATRRSRKKR